MSLDEEIVRLYPWLLRMAKRFCANKEDAEDLAGDTVYKVLSNRERYNEDRDLKPWCIAIMSNTFKTMYHHKALITFVDYDSAYYVHSPYSSQERANMNSILSGIRKCARRTGTIRCVLYYAKGYSYDEISSMMDIPVGTVKSRISFGRNMLKAFIGQ